MVETPKKNTAAYVEAANLLAAALDQLRAISKALAAAPSNAQLEGASERVRDAVNQIRSAMSSGTLDASSIASLSAALNTGVDSGALGAEAGNTGRAVVVRMQLSAASLESHVTVQRMAEDVFDRHEFDANVERHTHGAELEAFRKRQAEDEKYIHEQLQRHTAGGDLNASGRMQNYMLDANAHGAGDNPEFMKNWNELKTKTDRLRASMQAAGMSTQDYDWQIKQDVSNFLKAKGLSDKQVEDALAKSDNPLDAVQPYLGSDKDSRALADRVGMPDKFADTSRRTAVETPDNDQPLTIDLNAMNARLTAAGLDAPASVETTGHGLAIQKPQTLAIER